MRRAREDRSAVTNPTLLVEVTCPSTEAYDRGAKLEHYQQLPTLEAVIFVAHRERRITVVERQAAGWRATDFGPGEEATLTARGVRFPVDEVYAVLRELEG